MPEARFLLEFGISSALSICLGFGFWSFGFGAAHAATEIPNPRPQIPRKLQITIIKEECPKRVSFWSFKISSALGFPWDLVFGIWSFGFATWQEISAQDR
jgi:hypothetical protein